MTHIDIVLNDLLIKAVSLSISDIHFDLLKNSGRILFRRHKHFVDEYPCSSIVQVFEHLRFIAGFDLSKGNMPQTGSFSYVVDDTVYDFRFASIETFNRKHAVLRILNMNQIDTLNDSVVLKTQQKQIRRLIKESNGIILFCGKTGSGKSTTLFNASKELVDHQIFSLENPIERIHDSCVQIELNETLGLNFEEALSQLLRHDPDVIILGEIRSEEDIRQCIRCGLSGHLVMSTIHSGSIQHVLNRLIDLGARLYDLKHVLKGIIHQEMSVNNAGVVVKYTIEGAKEIQARIEAFESSKEN